MSFLDDIYRAYFPQRQTPEDYRKLIASLMGNQQPEAVNVTAPMSPLFSGPPTPESLQAMSQRQMGGGAAPQTDLPGSGMDTGQRQAAGLYDGPSGSPGAIPGLDKFGEALKTLPPAIGTRFLLDQIQTATSPETQQRTAALQSRQKIADMLSGVLNKPADFAPVNISPQTAGTDVQPPAGANVPPMPMMPPTPQGLTGFDYGGKVTQPSISPDLIRNLALQSFATGGNPADVTALMNIGKGEAPIKGSPGDVFFDPSNGYQPVASVPNKQLEAQSPLGKLAADLQSGRINPEQFKAGYDKETRLPAGPQPTDTSFLAPILAKIQKGQPLTEADNTILSVLKPSATIAPPGNAPGTIGAPKIDPSIDGYATKPVPNAGGLTQSAIDQGAIYLATEGALPSGMGIGSTGAGGQKKSAIQNRAAELNAGGNMAANKGQIKSFTQSLGQQQKYLDTTQRALNTANDTLDALQEWMQKNNVNPNQFPDFNTFSNFLKAKGIDPGVAGGYNAQLATLRAEYSQVLAKGGVRSVETDREAAKLIPAGLAPADLAKVADRIKVDGMNVTRDAQNQVAKVTEQMNNIIGGNASASYQPPPTGGALPSGVTEEDIQHTLKLHPEITRDQLLQKLGGK